MLIGLSNGIRGANRLTAPKALGDTDNDMSCHAHKYGTGRTRFQLQFPFAFCERTIILDATVSVLEWIEMLLAIGNIRATEFLHPYSQMSSGFPLERVSTLQRGDGHGIFWAAIYISRDCSAGRHGGRRDGHESVAQACSHSGRRYRRL